MSARVAREAEPDLSDEAVRKATGRDWDEWTSTLDDWGARDRSHTEIARHVVDDHNIDGWWAQSVTVGYERIRGMRKPHQRPDGFSMSASKTVAVPVATLFELFVDDGKRAEWLGEGALRLRTAVQGKSARFDILDGSGILGVYFVAKGDKAAAQLQLEKISTEEALTQLKATWKARLSDLADYIRHDS